MKLDCYAVLGLSPAAEDVVIRAAYLALMRSYHPDRNGSAEAAARARAITEAYETIGDPVRRAEYDASRMTLHFEILGYDERPEPPPRLTPKTPVIHWPKAPVIHWPKAPVFGAVAASALAVVLAVVMLPRMQSVQADIAPHQSTAPSAKAIEADEAAATPSRATEKRRAPEPVAAVASTAKEISPPPASAAPEKTLAKVSEPARAVASKPVPAKVDEPPRPKRISERPSAALAARPAQSKPAPVDEKARVASLERMSTSFYNQSVNHADESRRSQLQQARDLFVNSRNACRSDKCIGDAHAGYIRDISRIMEKPRQANP